MFLHVIWRRPTLSGIGLPLTSDLYYNRTKDVTLMSKGKHAGIKNNLSIENIIKSEYI